MTLRYVIDTNILVHSLSANSLAKQTMARDVLGRCARQRTAALPAQVLGELANVALRKMKPPMQSALLLAEIDSLARAFPILPLTAGVVLEAVRAVRDYQISYYDAQIWAVAKLAQIPIVLSEDFSSGTALEGVTFLNPFARSFDVDSL